MVRFLNVGILQMPVSPSLEENQAYIAARLEELMNGYHKPELVVGVEWIGMYAAGPIPGPATDFFADLARRYGIYLIPGTMSETSPELPEGQFYNAAPIFGPDGRLIDVYRKMAPYRPAEPSVPGRRYVVFDIPEKQTKVGVQICYDLNFPEISRNETLMGAEVLVKLTMDPTELYQINKPLHFARATENQAYLVSTNGVGQFESFHLYGNSLVIDPEGHLLWEAGEQPAVATVTLDLDRVSQVRRHGSLMMDHYLQHLRDYDFPQPFAGSVSEAPLFRQLPPTPGNLEEYEADMRQLGIGVPVQEPRRS